MKKIISFIALFSILFSSIGTSISVYADSVSISAPTNDGEGLANTEHRTDPLFDKIDGQGLSGGELALHYIHNKITLSGKKYIIAQNATASEKAILLQEIPEYDGSNRNEINNLKDQKIKIIEDIFNKPITGVQLSHLSNIFTPHIQRIEMGLTGRELAGIWQTKLTREGLDYLLEHNASTREKSLARELRSFTNQRDNAETDGNQAVLGLGSGDGFQLLMRLISRGVTKTQLQYLVDNNMLDYIITENDEGLNISAPTQDPNISKIESPEEREARLKREEKAREEEAAKLKEEAKQKDQEQQEKLGGLSESSLFKLLSERKITNDGLEFLITLRGNLTKDEINLILNENKIKSTVSRKKVNLREQLVSKLYTTYNTIFQKLAKGGLTKEENTNFSKFIKTEVEKKERKVSGNSSEQNDGTEQPGKVKNAFHTMNASGTQSNPFINNLEYIKIVKKNTKMTGLVTSVGGKNQSTYNGVPYFVNKSGKQDEIFFPYIIWHKSLLNDWGEYRVEKIVNGTKYNLGNTRTVDDDSTTYDLDNGKYSDLLGVENGNIFYYSAALNRLYSTKNSFRSKRSFTLPVKAKQHNGHLIDIYMFDIYDKDYFTYLDKLNNIHILKYTDNKLNKIEIKQNDLRKIYGFTDDININKIGFIKNNNDYNYYIITDKGLLLYNINFDNDGTIEKSIIKKIDGDLGYNGYARGFSYDYENNIIFYFKYNSEKTFNSLYALNVNINNKTFGKTISILDGSLQKLKIKGISKKIGENKLGLLISSPGLGWYDDIEIGSLTYSVNKQKVYEPVIIDVDEGDYMPGIPNFGGDNTSNKTSSDEYVNEKLKEINDCFKSTYDNHLDNIEKTIYSFTKSRDSSNNQKTKAKYQKAIDKLQEIKELFIERYKFLIDYDDGNFGERISNGDDQNGEVGEAGYKEEDTKNRVYDDNNNREVKQGNTGGFTSGGGTFKIH